MRYHDEDEAPRLNAESWQLDLLKLNPQYLGWGPHEDYMWTKGEGWNSPQIFDTWAAFGPWKLDDLNECVNFYFSVNRASEDCKTCGGNGYHPDAQGVVNGFYEHMNGRGAHWHDSIVQEECDALIGAGRLKAGATAEEVNAQNAPGARGFGHDAINRMILTEARLRRLGLPVRCPTCEGRGYVHTEPAAHVSLTLWWLHPRKGCSRGLEVKRLDQGDLPAVFSLLRDAATRNADRFAKLPV